MDSAYPAALLEMGTSLAALAVKGTASAVNTKIKTIKDEKILRKYDPPTMKLLMS